MCSILTPPSVIFISSVYLNQRKIPPSVEIPAVILWAALVGGGAGYLQMAFAVAQDGLLRPDRIFQPAGAMLGAIFASIVGPLFYFLAFRRAVSVQDVARILIMGLATGCAAALLMGAPSMIITIVAVLLALAVTYLRKSDVQARFSQ